MTRGQFNAEQVSRLLRPIRPNRVFHNQGQSNVAGWDIRAHLTRMFGFGNWEKQILDLELISEVPRENPAKSTRAEWTGWYVTYRCTMQLRVYVGGELAWCNEDVATGSAQNQPHLHDAHDLAVKNAATYALKRCAIDLGDQFGLSLYRGGSTDAVVGMTLVGMPGEEPDVQVDGEGVEP
jgi:recombination DNA repair RAD52 pathway protein